MIRNLCLGSGAWGAMSPGTGIWQGLWLHLKMEGQSCVTVTQREEPGQIHQVAQEPALLGNDLFIHAGRAFMI